MNILSGLLAISLLVLTLVGASQLFLKTDKHLLRQQEQFIELTKKQLKKGSINLIGATLAAFLSAILLFLVFRMKLEFHEAQYREKTYLCFLFLNRETSIYVKRMAKMNISLRALYILKNTNLKGASTNLLFETLKNTRNLLHSAFMKKIVKNDYCSLPYTMDYLKNFPYLLKNKIELDVYDDETSKLRATQWQNVIWQPPKGIRLKKVICLKTFFKMSSPFSPVSISATQELSWEEALKSRCWFG